MGSRGALLLLLLLCQFCFLQLVQAQGTPSNSTTTPDPDLCEFKGDDNTYGLGIRIGLYLQWITSNIAFNFVPEEAPNVKAVNSAFQLANFGGLLFITLSNGIYQPTPRIYAIECWIVLTFCLGGICSGWQPRPRRGEQRTTNYTLHNISVVGELIQMIVVAALIYYALWYVFYGMDQMAHPLCNRYAFFFTRVDLYGWFRVVLKIIFVVTAAAIAIMAVLILCGFMLCVRATSIYQIAVTIIDYQLDPSHPSPLPDGLTRLSNITISLSLVMFIISTELVIRWNNITNVNTMGSTGQILPIIGALYSLVTVAWEFTLKAWRGEYDLENLHHIHIGCLSWKSKSTRQPRRRQRLSTLVA